MLEQPTYNRERSYRYIQLSAAVPRLLFTQWLEHSVPAANEVFLRSTGNYKLSSSVCLHFEIKLYDLAIG